MTRKQRQAKYAADHRWMVGRLTALYQNASNVAMSDGRWWYDTAADTIEGLAQRHSSEFAHAAGVVAALSPQTRWRENLRAADVVLGAVLDGKPYPNGIRVGYTANVRKAERIANGETPLAVLGGPKVRSFYRNLTGDRDAVTVDVWAARAATGCDEAHSPAGTHYERLVRAYTTAAEMCDECPRDFQAIIWIAMRPMAEHWRDRQLRLDLGELY